MPDYQTEWDAMRAGLRLLSLKILVWGPGKPGAKATSLQKKAYAKRLQIRSVLRKDFPCSEVYFSEDDEMVKITDGILGQLNRQALQARLSDLIIMLDTSRGADLELDHFVPKYPWFRDKVHVFLPKTFVPPSGLVKQVFDHLRPDQIYGFTPNELKVCTVATVKSVSVAETFALMKQLRGS